MSRLSILIPWRESTSLFEGTLVSILANRPSNSEVIVVHRGAYDDPYSLGREVLFVEHDEDASLSALVNRGLEVAGGDVLHLLACGVTVEEGWSDGVREVFVDDPTLGAIIPLVVEADNRQRIVNSGVSLSLTGGPKTIGAGRRTHRPSVNAWGPSLLAGFYRLAAVRELGGFADEVGEHLDVDLAGSLVQADYEIYTAPESQLMYHTAETPARAATAREVERLFWRHRSLLGSLGLFAHAAHATCDSLFSLCTGGGFQRLRQRLGAAMERRQYRQHQEIIEAAMIDGETAEAAEVYSLEAARQQRRETAPSHRRAA